MLLPVRATHSPRSFPPGAEILSDTLTFIVVDFSLGHVPVPPTQTRLQDLDGGSIANLIKFRPAVKRDTQLCRRVRPSHLNSHDAWLEFKRRI